MNPCLHLAITRLSITEAEHFAIWVLNASYPSGYVHHDCVWPESLTQTWVAWQDMFSLRGLPNVPFIHHASQPPKTLPPEQNIANGPGIGYAGGLMQGLGIQLWKWLFDGSIQSSLDQSQGIAIGERKPLRLRLEIRDPDLIALPWEIMQPQAGKPTISLNQELLLFSRTTSDVDKLQPQRPEQALNILLVLGQHGETATTPRLQLEEEAVALAEILQHSGQPDPAGGEHEVSVVTCRVDTLVQPTSAELIARLETEAYNILFYAGHGVPGPDGGVLFLRPDTILNGKELAQILVRCRVKLCVVNACWGAQPDHHNQQTLERSSLAEVLIHHGVPAVLGMRDSIDDQEALNFIQAFAQALAARMPIDQAVAMARRQLLMLYRFNHPAWTLPVLYMHPEFDGELVRPMEQQGPTEIPPPFPHIGPTPPAYFRSIGPTARVWQVRGARMRVGRLQNNDIVIQEQWVSQEHAEIIRRSIDSINDDNAEPTYWLHDFSRNGTFILESNGWKEVHHEEVQLQSGVKLKFGNINRGQALEFIIES